MTFGEIRAIVVLVVLLIVGASMWYMREPVASEEVRQPLGQVEVMEESPREVVEDPTSLRQGEAPLGGGGPAVDPVSLIAFAEQEFTGRDFKVGRVLAENEAYTRYY